MDQVTQQNAALVEEMAASASSLKSQAVDLVEIVAVFKLDTSRHLARSTVRSAAPFSAPFRGGERRTIETTSAKPKPAITAKAAPSGGRDEWETF
jgi:hypothetical protein